MFHPVSRSFREFVGALIIAELVAAPIAVRAETAAEQAAKQAAAQAAAREATRSLRDLVLREPDYDEQRSRAETAKRSAQLAEREAARRRAAPATTQDP